VREGGEVVIYDRETAVARMVPLAPFSSAGADQDRLARLERRGLIRRGQESARAAVTRSHRPAAVPRVVASLE